MRRLRAWLRRTAGFFAHARVERELREEFESHLQLHIDDNIRAGMTPAQARREALLKYGPVEAIKDVYRERSGLPFLESLLRDVRFGFRTLRREPGFAAAAVATLAFGIGANTAVFSVVDPVLLRPLPYAEPHRIVEINGGGQAFARFGKAIEVSPPALRESPAFTSVGLYLAGGANLGGEPAARIAGAEVTPAFFDVLDVSPVRGRWFTDEDVAASAHLAVISHRLWQERFDGDDAIVGRTIILDSAEYTILGVMPEGVRFPNGAIVWVPTSAPAHISGVIPAPRLIARLAPGVSVQDAKAAVIAASGMKEPRASRIKVVPIREALVGTVRSVAVLVWIAAALVLLVACINAANLLLARVSRREHEFAVRRALGASGGQLMRQVSAESFALALVAAAVAVPAAVWPLHAVRVLLPANLHGVADITINTRALVATGAVAILATVLFGLAPAFAIRSRSAEAVLRAQATSTVDAFWRRFRSTLLAAEVAIAVVLLVGATTLVVSVRAALQSDLGIRGERAIVFELSPPRAKYKGDGPLRVLHASLDAAVRAIPGVEEVGVTNQLPGRVLRMMLGRPVTASGLEVSEGGPQSGALVTASPGYFSASGIELLAGRFFTPQDGVNGRRTLIVSESYARALNARPEQLVGLRSPARGPDGATVEDEIVGVVRDVRFWGPEDAVHPTSYMPHAMAPGGFGPVYLVVRTTGDPTRMVPAVRAAVSRIDADLPLYNVQTFDEIRAALFAERRFAMITMVAFASMTFLLSAIGLYGVISYLVQLRTREIGIRLAIGAPRLGIYREVFATGLRHAAAGLLSGVALALATSRYLGSRVPGMDRIEPQMVVALGGMILAVAALATMVPAWRAMRIDPVRTLRAD